MTNEILAVRTKLQQDFDRTFLIAEEHAEDVSPCGRYRLVTDAFGTVSDPSFPAIVLAVVQSNQTGETIATMLRNDSRVFHSWIKRDGRDYLLLAEDLEGQSVVDLTEGTIAGFSSKDGDFIWTEFHPSPNKEMLAIVGCYWACPCQIVVYDFRNPMRLPLPFVGEFDLPGNDARFGEWVTANSFSIINGEGLVQLCCTAS